MSLQLSCQAGNQVVNCQLSWSGSQPNDIIDYIIFYYLDGSSNINSQSTQSLSSIISGLTNDSIYHFYAVAYESGNTNGQSLSETSVVQSIPATIPSVPTGLSAVVSTSGNVISQQVNLSWSASTTDSHYPILNYNVYQSTDNTNFSLIASPNALSYNVTGLTNATTYYFTVSSTSLLGSSAQSSSISATPTGLASQPLNMVVHYDAQVSNSSNGGYQKVDLSWSAPNSNGGNAVSSYNIQYSLLNDFSSGVTTVNNVSTSDAIQNSSFVTPYADRNLSTGWYFFRVCAVTSLGNGVFCNPVTITPQVAPVAVQSLTSSNLNASAQHQSGCITLAWQYSPDNATPLLGYMISYLDASNNPQSIYVYEPSTSPTYTITGLQDGYNYTMNVIAFNSIGMAPSSQISQIPSTMADAPVLSITAHTGTSISMSWTTPANNGNAITGYRILRGTDGVTFSQIATNVSGNTYTDTDVSLVKGTVYYYEVEAQNANGNSLPSNIVHEYPSQVPNAPSSITATNSNASSSGNQVTVSFTFNPDLLANDNGDDIASFHVYRSDNYTVLLGSITATNGVSNYNYVDNTAINSNSYAYEISSINRDGEGVKSTASNSVVVSGLPDVVSGLNAVSGNQQISLSWNLLNVCNSTDSNNPNDEGSAITHYLIYKDSSLLATVGSSTNSYSDVNSAGNLVQNGVTHSYQIQSQNSNGSSALSSMINQSGSSAPDVPSGLSASHNVGGSSVTLSWNLLNTAPYPASSPSDEGRSVSLYNIYQSTDNVTFALVKSVNGSTDSTIINPLTNGTLYYFEISATNSVGEGTKSSSISVTPSTSPSVVNNVQLVPTVDQLEISFSQPTTQGGLNYTYNVQVLDPNSAVVYNSSGSTNLHYVATSLAQNTQFTVKIYANNGVDTNYNIYSTTATTQNIPDPINNLTNNAGTISWSAPTALLSIQEFLLVISDITNSNASCSVSIPSNTQTSISNNIYSYSFTPNAQNMENANFNSADTMRLSIFAINSIGVSPISNIVQIN